MRKGFTCSAFDLLHAGHVLMLEEAKSQCDYLVVGLHVDPSRERESKNTPVQTLLERFIQLKACKYVDEVVPYETEGDLLNLLALLKPDVRILGREYEGRDFTGKEFPNEFYFNSRDHSWSSSELRKRVCISS